MPSGHAFALFIPAALALLAVPGPAVLYIVAQSMQHGRRAGLVSVAGIHVGSLVHIGAAAAGLSALLVSSALAFNVVKYAGAAYLIGVGILTWLRRVEPGPLEAPEPRRLRNSFAQGIVVNVLNPKTALFFFAFMPQFVDTDRSAASQILVLGAVWIVLGLASDGAYALAAGTLRGLLARSRRFLQGQRFFSGGVFILLGITAALTKPARS